MTPADLIDPNQRPLYAVPLIGEILVDGAYQPLEITPGPEGCIMGYSPALGVSLAVKDKRLVVYDHELGEFVAEFEEQERAKMQAQAEAQAESGSCRGERAERAAATIRAGGGVATSEGGRSMSTTVFAADVESSSHFGPEPTKSWFFFFADPNYIRAN